ncbi:MAG: CvpA family protein [Patescibacteria group bacterium]|nr:CvpA family protein [Patescibacteria group bacterium]
MTPIDIAILVMLGCFVLAGLWFGVIHMIGAVVGFFLGAWAAGHYYEAGAAWLTPFIGGNGNLAKLIVFCFIFLLVGRLVGVIMHLIDKIFRIVAIIPFLKTFNRLLGAAFGLVEGTLVLGLAVYFAAKFPVNAAFELALRQSQLGHALNVVGMAATPLLPAAVKMAQSVL